MAEAKDLATIRVSRRERKGREGGARQERIKRDEERAAGGEDDAAWQAEKNRGESGNSQGNSATCDERLCEVGSYEPIRSRSTHTHLSQSKWVDDMHGDF